MSTLAIMLNCILKAIAAIANLSHAKERTGRTVESTNGHKAFVTKVWLATILLTGILLYMLVVHQAFELNMNAVYASQLNDMIDGLRTMLVC